MRSNRRRSPMKLLLTSHLSGHIIHQESPLLTPFSRIPFTACPLPYLQLRHKATRRFCLFSLALYKSHDFLRCYSRFQCHQIRSDKCRRPTDSCDAMNQNSFFFNEQDVGNESIGALKMGDNIGRFYIIYWYPMNG
jgi:hypothetical protein